MRVMAQIAMVMNLDKCIGCHTCSVTCKQAWTNRQGTEYIWFNNVETRPGMGYPRTWEDQEKWNGGWTLDGKGRLKPKQGGRVQRLATIFHNPNMPSIEDYYEPWTYEYEKLMAAPAHCPAGLSNHRQPDQQGFLVLQLGRQPRRLAGDRGKRPGAQAAEHGGQAGN